MREHSTALVATLLSAAFVAARLLTISRFDVNTAAMILQVSGVGTAVAGTALTLLPFALFATTCLLAVIAFLDPSVADLPVSARPLFWVSLAATVCLTATGLAVLTLAIVLATAAYGIYTRRKRIPVDIRDEVRRSAPVRAMLTILSVVLVLVPIVLQRPWLPVQAITLSDGSITVGYVLGESEGDLAVLDDADRTVHLLDPQAIRTRTICSGPPNLGGAAEEVPQVSLEGSLLGMLLWGDHVPSYPSCPDADD